MAAVEKMYGTAEQYHEFKAWLEECKPDALDRLYPEPPDDGRNHTVALFDGYMDAWLLVHCPFDWVIREIRRQYGG